MLINFQVYCNDTAAAGHDGAEVEVKILTFAPLADGSFEWTTPVDGLRIDDERVLPSAPDYFEIGTAETARWRRTYACPACSDAVTVLDEKFRPIVEQLLRHGESRLSLAGLRVTLAPR